MRACFAALIAMTVAGCGGSQLASAPAPLATAELRELTDAEKKIIAAAVAAGMRERTPGQIRWTKFMTETPKDGLARYCATVNGKMFVASVTVAEGKAAAAQLMAVGGSTGGYVDQECRRYYANPFV